MHGAGMGAPMMPMMPPVPQRGGGSNDSEHKVLTYDGREHLHGEDAKAEAVRGGTIAQKRPD